MSLTKFCFRLLQRLDSDTAHTKGSSSLHVVHAWWIEEHSIHFWSRRYAKPFISPKLYRTVLTFSMLYGPFIYLNTSKITRCGCHCWWQILTACQVSSTKDNCRSQYIQRNIFNACRITRSTVLLTNNQILWNHLSQTQPKQSKQKPRQCIWLRQKLQSKL